MPDKKLRNDDTTVGKKIWEEVDRAAEGAPQWVKDRLKESERPSVEKRAHGGGHMKRLANLTEDQAMDVLARLPQYRVVRGAQLVRSTENSFRFDVEVETYSAEEIAGAPR